MGAENPLYSAAVISAVAVLPFVVLSTTSFLKLSIVFGILKNALGAQQVPSGAIIALLSLVLTVHIMRPVGDETYALLQENGLFEGEKKSIEEMLEIVEASGEPVRKFLIKHSEERERLFFSKGEEGSESLMTLVPAFVLTELAEAFMIGFTVFLPFLVVDLVIANLLVGLGMMMVSPITIALPFKLLLFVLCDGWFLLSRGLVLTYG